MEPRRWSGLGSPACLSSPFQKVGGSLTAPGSHLLCQHQERWRQVTPLLWVPVSLNSSTAHHSGLF